MFKNNLIEDSVKKLCTESYQRSDVEVVISYLVEITKGIISKKSNLPYFLGEWNDFHQELEDMALDYIALLFARDENGVFIELKMYFDPVFQNSAIDISDAIQQLVQSTVHQESIRTFESRDPVGKIFYRSLRYILTKHPEWEKTKSSEGSSIITLVGIELPVASEKLINDHVRIVDSGSAGLTKGIENGLILIIEKNMQSVPIRLLLQTVRSQINTENQSINHVSDPGLGITIDIHVQNVLQSIDNNILWRYEKNNKLHPEERKGFILALNQLLMDFHSGNGSASYYDYLAAELPHLDSQEQYHEHYRKQFEYVAKIAKQTFSASVKTDFKLN